MVLLLTQPIKCKFALSELEFLGHMVDKHGVRPLAERVAAVRDFPTPNTPYPEIAHT